MSRKPEMPQVDQLLVCVRESATRLAHQSLRGDALQVEAGRIDVPALSAELLEACATVDVTPLERLLLGLALRSA
jgi:hypothetical protein